MHGVIVRSGSKVGRVINVFERTVNVRTVEDELLVITLDRTRSPANLNVSAGQGQAGFVGLAMEGQDVVADMIVDHTVLHAGGVAVSIGEPDVFHCSLNEPVAGFLHTFSAEIESVFSALVAGGTKRKGCLLNADMTTEGLLVAFLDRLETPEARSDQDAVAVALSGLCGRGPGFTPAGDDFIAGFLAAYNRLGRALKQWLPIIPGREFSRLTTWTSFKLMEYSARGLLDEQAQALLNSIASGDVEDCIRCIEVIGRRGHTSGMDFATGVAAGVCTTSDWVFQTGALTSISSILLRKPAQLS
jgi:hypothetical protein